MNESFLEARQVTKRYANHTALEEVSIQVPKGQVFGLLGPNGAGKTTLIRIINRITAPDAGEVWFDGHLSQPQDIYSIGYLPEERGLYKKMKVGEQAGVPAQLRGLSRQGAKKRLTDWFDRFDIMPWWNKKLEELSKGMQQKVQFVITVLHRPPLLIFDEPFSGFDPVNAELLKREILKLKEEGHTIIFSTHNMASVEEICDHIALINHSQVVLQGAVQDIRSQYKSNQYELTVRSGNPLPESDAFEVVDSQVVDAQTVSYKLRKLTSISNSEMLSLIGAQTEIIQFSECIPSMNDIFIRTVEGKI